MEESKRTSKQNRALHKFFDNLARELNEAGLDMRVVLKPEVDIPWNRNTVKEYIWRPIQKHQLLKKSTTELSTKDIDEVFLVISKMLGEKFGLQIDFPSIENFLDYDKRGDCKD